jgi:carbohydrate-selective porin OprB
MPTFANGNKFDGDIRNARGDNVELTLAAPHDATVRVLAYLNQGRMGRYAVATAIAEARSVRPDIVADDAPGRTKYGFGVNGELPLADSGSTGAFARLGWNDGRNESFVFTEVDAHASAGVQVSGRRWHRNEDVLGIAAAAEGLSLPHRAYLAAGGKGFLLGDGALRYGPEAISETYYRCQLGAHAVLSPDVMFINNPGYNRDRGPAVVLSFRMNVHL